MKLKNLAFAALTSGLLGVFAAPAQATLLLTLDAGGGNVITIVDGGIGDTDGSVGGIAWAGSLGTWLGNFTAGVSNSPGFDDLAFLNLSSGNVSSRRGGTLTITLTDDGFTTPNGMNLSATSQTQGFTTGSVGFGSLLGLSPFNGSSGSGLFSQTNSTSLNINGGFTLSQVAVLSHNGAGISLFSATTTITTVPEPATLGLLGLGLVGLGFVRRRRNA